MFEALTRLFRAPRPAGAVWPALPAGERVYAIGDIHGEIVALTRLMRRIVEDADGRAATVVPLGDYVDRGPDSRAVLDLLSGPAPAGMRWRPIRGNHEAAMLEFLSHPAQAAGWLDFGGRETLASYGIAVPPGRCDGECCRALCDALHARLPDSHLEFLIDLPFSVSIGDFLFVHAGVHPRRRLDRQRPLDLMTIREPFLSSRRRLARMIVHGHTVVDAPQCHPGRIAIDTGVYRTGVLTALCLDGNGPRFLQASGRHPD